MKMKKDLFKVGTLSPRLIFGSELWSVGEQDPDWGQQ